MTYIFILAGWILTYFVESLIFGSFAPVKWSNSNLMEFTTNLVLIVMVTFSLRAGYFLGKKFGSVPSNDRFIMRMMINVFAGWILIYFVASMIIGNFSTINWDDSILQNVSICMKLWFVIYLGLDIGYAFGREAE